MTPTPPVPLTDAGDAEVFGGKAAQLAAAARAGLPVPPGIALSWTLTDAVAAGGVEVSAVLAAAGSLGDFVAVRSSAVGEDSDLASFAGQHESLLNVPLAGLAHAVAAVWQSVHGGSALAYRERVGVTGEPRAGVVIQRMVVADVAGVAFCPNPVTGAQEVVIECAWGLGEAVAGGLVVPDLVRLSAEGEVVERRPGAKDRTVVPREQGGTTQRVVGSDRAAALCLEAGQAIAVFDLVQACRRVFGGTQDIEWAFARDTLWLLQRRAVTRGR